MQILILNSDGLNCQRFMPDTLETEVLQVDSCNALVRESTRKEIVLIVAHADQEGLASVFTTDSIPPQIPILILSHDDVLPTWFRNQAKYRLIDFLQVPLSEQAVLTKIQFLLQVHKNSKKLKQYQNEIATLNTKLTTCQQSIKEHSAFLDLLSNRDGLTGLYNRRQFSKILLQEYQRAIEEDRDLSLLLLNIDYFNEINKSSGLGFGDFILNELSARLTQNNRPDDTCFRYSGEDFIVLMPSTDLDTAQKKAENLRRIIKEKPFDNGYVRKGITVSIGISSIEAHKPENHEELIVMADQALYFAKSEGRDRISIFRTLKNDKLGSSEKNFIALKKTITRILEKTRTSTINSLHLLAKDVTPEENQQHIRLTQKYVQLLCEHLHLPPLIIATFKNAVTLHTSIHHLLHADITRKKSNLSQDDREMINDLPYKLLEITHLFDYFSNERTLLLYHGEHFDGTGYPEGLRGDAIPLGARIFHLVDSLVAMDSNRPYRPKLAPEQILRELVEHAGTQFDPFLVHKLIDVIEENSLLDIDSNYFTEARTTLINKKNNKI